METHGTWEIHTPGKIDFGDVGGVPGQPREGQSAKI